MRKTKQLYLILIKMNLLNTKIFVRNIDIVFVFVLEYKLYHREIYNYILCTKVNLTLSKVNFSTNIIYELVLVGYIKL